MKTWTMTLLITAALEDAPGQVRRQTNIDFASTSEETDACSICSIERDPRPNA